MTHQGRVTAVLPFGAFVEVAPGVVGLLHEREQGEPLRVGARVLVRIDQLDGARRRLSLTVA